MSTVEKSIEVRAPLSAAYHQWMQFEDFPIFMEGITDVEQVDDTHLHWCADIDGRIKEWDAEITEQIPGQRIAWRSLNGAPYGGAVSFRQLKDDCTRIRLEMDYDSQGAADNAAHMRRLSRRIEGDLERFKDFLEAQDPGDSWHLSIDAPHSRVRH